MSILTQTPVVTPPVATPTPEELLAQRIAAMASRNSQAAKNLTLHSVDTLTENLLSGLNVIWESESPSAVLAEIGTDAVELFALSRDTATFLLPQLTGKRDAAVAEINAAFGRMKPYTEHADGTVTVN